MGYTGDVQEQQRLTGSIRSAVSIDASLTKEGYAADAKAVGDAIARANEELNKVGLEITNLKSLDASGVQYSNETLEADNVMEALNEITENYLSKKGGGLVDGTFGTRHYDNGYSTINKNHSETADYGTQLVDTAANGKNCHIDICALLDTFNFVTSAGNAKKVFHEGVKPFGNYVGNGNATQRVVKTNAIGRMIIVYNVNTFAFVTPEGALTIKMSGGSISWIDGGKVFYINGDLNLLTTSDAFNANGTTYYYQAI